MTLHRLYDRGNEVAMIGSLIATIFHFLSRMSEIVSHFMLFASRFTLHSLRVLHV